MLRFSLQSGVYEHESCACSRDPGEKCGLRPNYELWRDFPYEYELDRLAIDLINGSELLRQWVGDPEATPDDLDALTTPDEAAWLEELEAVRLYA